LRAINAVDDAILRGAVRRYQDLIFALAVEHEAKLNYSEDFGVRNVKQFLVANIARAGWADWDQ
jgi:hypothetical protein